MRETGRPALRRPIHRSVAPRASAALDMKSGRVPRPCPALRTSRRTRLVPTRTVWASKAQCDIRPGGSRRTGYAARPTASQSSMARVVSMGFSCWIQCPQSRLSTSTFGTNSASVADGGIASHMP